MILKYIHADSSYSSLCLDLNTKITNKWVNINTQNKFEFIKEFLPLFSSGQKIILFDSKHKQLLKFHQDNDINFLENINEVNKKNKLLFFTSGSSGFPTGAFKSKKNLEQEVLILKQLVEKYKIKKVVVTVPFVHIYGIIAGLLLPLSLDDITLVVKEDFLPYELLEEATQEHTLVITTPIFIKSLSKLGNAKKLNTNLFISSTGPLHKDDVDCFTKKYQTSIMQIFGSTETGGIAYKFNKQTRWTPLEKVKIEVDSEKLCVSSPFVSPFILNKKIIPLHQPFVTEDIIEIKDDTFSLVGRSNKIIKINGKRISALQIEAIIENIDNVQKAIIEVIYKKELLRSEQILITLQATQKIEKSLIKKSIASSYGVLTIPFTLKYVDTIDTSAMGKKIIF